MKKNNGNNKANKQDLVVEVVAGHSFRSKEGESFSPFVEVEFENQRLKTQVKQDNLNPVWNEKLVFPINDVADLPQRSVKVSVFSERRSSNGRNLVGKTKISGSWAVAKEGDPMTMLCKLDKEKSCLFSHGNGEISLKLYLSNNTDHQVGQARKKKEKKKLQQPSADATEVHRQNLQANTGETGQNMDDFLPTKSTVYLSPKLWYLRVSIIEGQDIVANERGSASTFITMDHHNDLFARAQVGANQILRSKRAQIRSNLGLLNPYWTEKEDMMFVVAEPFEDELLVSIENRLGPNQDEVLGGIQIPIKGIERITDEKQVTSRWYTLDQRRIKPDSDSSEGSKFVPPASPSRIRLRAFLDGRYCVSAENRFHITEIRPTVEQCCCSIGILELGVVCATGLVRMKTAQGIGRTDAYCVAKHDRKWFRTHTVVNSFSPEWKARHDFQVFDPCTFITIGVFDDSRNFKNRSSNNNSNSNNNNNTTRVRDSGFGIVRIRLSALERGRLYEDLCYPLFRLVPSGVKKMGELHLSLKFSAVANQAKILHMYTLPLLPMKHYTQGLGPQNLDRLQYHAMGVITTQLSQAELPLGREVIEFMVGQDYFMWSLRKSKMIFFRAMRLLGGAIALGGWLKSIRDWHSPTSSTLFLTFFLLLVAFPELIVPGTLLCLFLVLVWRYKWRPPQYLPHIDTKLSMADTVHPDELDEEFDTFPTSRPSDIVRMRYDRMRSVGGRLQVLARDVVIVGEQVEALLSWHDRHATFLLVILCLFAGVCFCWRPKVLVALFGLYVFRPPIFRSKLHFRFLVSLFSRLPSKEECCL